jgi:hypothetical protein
LPVHSTRPTVGLDAEFSMECTTPKASRAKPSMARRRLQERLRRRPGRRVWPRAFDRMRGKVFTAGSVQGRLGWRFNAPDDVRGEVFTSWACTTVPSDSLSQGIASITN